MVRLVNIWLYIGPNENPPSPHVAVMHQYDGVSIAIPGSGMGSRINFSSLTYIHSYKIIKCTLVLSLFHLAPTANFNIFLN